MIPRQGNSEEVQPQPADERAPEPADARAEIFDAYDDEGRLWLDTAAERDAYALARDLAAARRDQAAADRDRKSDDEDAELARVITSVMNELMGVAPPLSRGAERQRAATERALITAHRVRAAADRAAAARDREDAQRDRELAATDRAYAAAERKSATIDGLTGAWQRDAGLAQLRRELDRARRSSSRLVFVYIDVDGLKAVNDNRGHSAGDALLKRVVGALQAQLRSYESVVRLGGDEFACALSDVSLADATRRLNGISRQLSENGGGSFTAGFAELTPEDSLTDLIERADADLLATRWRSRGTPPMGPRSPVPDRRRRDRRR